MGVEPKRVANNECTYVNASRARGGSVPLRLLYLAEKNLIQTTQHKLFQVPATDSAGASLKSDLRPDSALSAEGTLPWK